jgi:hypothetical protein
MCKEMPVIPVNRVVNKKRMIGKMESQGGGEAQKKLFLLVLPTSFWQV